MIMTIFLLFVGLAFLFLISGYYIKEEILVIFGFLMLILIAFPLLNQSLEYKTGSITSFIEDNSSEVCTQQIIDTEEVYKYGDNYSGYHWDYDSPSPSVNDIGLFHRYTYNNYTTVCDYAINEVSEFTYAVYSDTVWYGLFFILVGISGEFSVWYLGYKKKEDDD